MVVTLNYSKTFTRALHRALDDLEAGDVLPASITHLAVDDLAQLCLQLSDEANFQLGAACFQHLPSDVPASYPLSASIMTLHLEALASFSDGAVFEVETHEDHLLIRFRTCPVCRGVQHNAPICDFITGYIQAAIGQNFRVEEVECHAMGHPFCLFQVA